MASNGPHLHVAGEGLRLKVASKVVSVQTLDEKSLFRGYRQVRLRPAGAFSWLRRSETYLLPPDAAPLKKGEVHLALDWRAQSLYDIDLQIGFRALVADGVKVRSLHWDEAERWGMRMELTGGSNLFGLLHSQWPMGEYDFNGYRIFMGRLPDESALLRIVGERGRMDLREAYEYLRTVQEPKMNSAEKTGVRA